MDKRSPLHRGATAGDLPVAVSEEKAKLKIEKSRIRRILYVIGGTLSLALAILGILLPGLPVTPLALLAAIMYARSSRKLYNKLLDNRLLGPRIRNYQRRQGVTRKGKVGIILFMTVMVLFSSFVVIQSLPLRMVILTLGGVGLIVVCFFVPTAQVDVESGEEEDQCSLK